jgi:hypothetical protein
MITPSQAQEHFPWLEGTAGIAPLIFHKIAENHVDCRGKVLAKSRFSALYSSLNHDCSNHTWRLDTSQAWLK